MIFRGNNIKPRNTLKGNEATYKKEKNCVICTNLKQNKQVRTSYVCDECGVALCIVKCSKKYHTKQAS